MIIERRRGDTAPDIFTLTEKATGDPANLAGCSAVLTVDTRENPTDATTQQYQLVGVISNPVDGVIKFSPSAAQADKLGTFYFDVQLTDATGAILTVSKGQYIYKQDITK
jgi:hypothetical protein